MKRDRRKIQPKVEQRFIAEEEPAVASSSWISFCYLNWDEGEAGPSSRKKPRRE